MSRWFLLLLPVWILTANADPPVGAWDARVPRAAKHQLAFVFSDDSTFISYGMTLDSGGLFLITGTWNVVNGDLSGSFRQIDPPISDSFTFTGHTSATVLRFKSEGIRVHCTPLMDPVGVMGQWNVLTPGMLASPVSITASNGLPDVFMISDGVMMVNANGRAVAFVEGLKLFGKFNTDAGTAVLRGKDQQGRSVKLKLERAS